MNLGMSFRASPLANEMFFEAKYTNSPTLKGASRRFLLASRVCFTRADKILSWAAMIASFFCVANCRTEGNSVDGVPAQSIVRGICPEFKKKGAYPVLSDRAELMANSMAGNLETQSL